MEAAAILPEQDFLEGQRSYVERQLRAGVPRTTVVSDLVGMGADRNLAASFVERAAKTVQPAGVAPTIAASLGGAGYAALGVFAGLVAALSGMLFAAIGVEATRASVHAGAPTISTVARIEAATLLAGVVVGVVLRRRLAPGPRWRPVVGGAAGLVAILAVRLITRVEIARELAGDGSTGLSVLRDASFWRSFASAPTNVFGAWHSPRVAPLVLWDVGFVLLAAFVAAVFSRNPAED